MRAKRPYIVLSFRTTVEAMAWKNTAKRNTSPGGSFRCPGNSLPGAALRGGCRPRTGCCASRIDPAAYDAAAVVEQ